MGGDTYFLYENITAAVCLCGSVITGSGCSDCDVTMATGQSSTYDLCSGQYTHLSGAANVMHDFRVSILSPSSASTQNPSMLEVLEEATFVYSGGPSGYDTSTWDFGDASTTTVFNTTSVSHTFLYVGTVSVSLTLNSSSTSAMSATQVSFQVTVSAPPDQAEMSCPASPTLSWSELSLSVNLTSAWAQRVTWTREDLSSAGMAGEGEGGYTSPEKGG